MSMSAIACPSCGEKGNIPDHLMGKKIRCPKCAKSFVAGASPLAPPAPGVASGSSGETIDVDGLDASSWASTVAVEARPDQPGPGAPTHFAPSAQGVDHPDGPATQYKVLTQKDRYFEGKFELSRLEDALNHYAGQGWKVRSMATPLVTGFSGGPREEIVVLLER